ncbi:MAG: tetratricopeptide repeat protein [Gemmatimonadetes bacterium]|nr:tetratricopeptide repeat protein [Gemmatimonadota bacterium]
MKLAGKINLALLLMILLPGIAFAQQETRETREANKFIGLAMVRQDPAERVDMYRQAVEQLRPLMAANTDNPLVWLLAGTALAGMGEIEEADRAFTRAQEMHPAYAEEIQIEREGAWLAIFNQGIQHMDQQRYPEAIAAMESAQTIYGERPEALMNLGALYANAGEYLKAEQALRQAIAATGGPLYGELEPEQKAEWDRFRAMATANVAQIQAQQGIESFEGEQFDSAAARFLRAAETNPHARDYWFNYGQALWAMSTPMEASLEGATQADSARVFEQLGDLYSRIQFAAQKAREFDPNNDVLYLMEARTHRMSGEFGSAAQREAGHQQALRLLESHDALTVHIDNVSTQPDEEGNVVISGQLTNVKAAESSSITLRFTLLGHEGDALATQDVVVSVPATEQVVTFDATVPVEGEIAGWKYVIAG